MSEKKKKPANKRSKVKHPSLLKRYNSRIRQEYIDMDYLDQLSPEEMKWMDDFMSEYNNAAIAKGSVKDKTDEKAKQNKFHRTAVDAKSCTDRNNERNRDIYSIAKARNLLLHHTNNDTTFDTNLAPYNARTNTNYTEDILIEILDETNELNKATHNGDDDSEKS